MSAKEAEEKEEGGAEGAEKPKKSKKKLFIILGVVLVLLGAGIPLAFMGGEEPKDGEHDEHHEEEKHYATAKLETFIVNLSENTTFLKVTMLIEYDPAQIEAAEKLAGGGGGHGAGGGGGEPAEGALPPLMEKRKPMIHDAVIRVLSSKKSTEVLTPDGKEQLKQELIEAINDAVGLDEGPVVNIYFTEFIIQ
ncbi:MAG: flagellar basal body-associated FliL family protein [Deltaproteobacteria bacterium]|nr:flagellar basal body-associated FliL family protein [Deltaproteobacteria bacterium]